MQKIMISGCLMGCKLRYNGSDLAIHSATFNDLLDKVEVVAFCPEVSAGLPIPRKPAEICNGDGHAVLNGASQVMCEDGSDVTQAFIKGAELALQCCKQQGITLAILTESSPSCGSSMIYNGRFERIKIEGKGVTSALLEQNGIRVFSQNQLDKVIREIR